MSERDLKREIAQARRRAREDALASYVTVIEVAAALKRTQSAVLKRARAEAWPSERWPGGSGGGRLVFLRHRLPDDVLLVLSETPGVRRRDDAHVKPGALGPMIFRAGVPRFLGARALATFVGLTVRAVQKRAKAERWPFVFGRATDPKGYGYLFDTFGLPDDLQGLLRGLVIDGRSPPRRGSVGAPGRDQAPARSEVLEAWHRYDAAAPRQNFRRIAAMRVEILREVETLVRDGHPERDACDQVALRVEYSSATIQRWRGACRGAHPGDWVALVAPRWKGRTATATIPAEAWEAFKADYLARSARKVGVAYGQLRARAAMEGWKAPSLRTLQRRLSGELSRLDKRPPGWRRAR